MAKKRKKTNHSQNILHAKKEAKYHFQETAKRILNTITGEKWFEQMPRYIRETFYESRYYMVNLVFPIELPVSAKRNLNKIFKHLLKRINIKILPSDIEIDMLSYLTVWKTIDFFFHVFPEEMESNYGNLRRFLTEKGFIDNYDNHDKETSNLNFAALIFSLHIGSSDSLIEFSYKDERDLSKNKEIMSTFAPAEQNVYLKIHNSEWRKFQINNKTHSAFKYGEIFPHGEVNWFNIEYHHFDSASAMGNLPVDIFIQKHAVNRLKERVDIVESFFMIIYTIESFKEPKLLKSGASYFLEYRVEGMKVGYFVGKLINGVFLIQTFLFLTNNGTPEGEKLNKNLGMMKLDKKFLSIDKLSTFLNLQDNEVENVKEIFSNCGINSLFTIRERKSMITARSIQNNKIKKDEIAFLEKIKKYIKPEEE